MNQTVQLSKVFFILILTLILATWSTDSYSQATLRGTISTQNNGAPIANAMIKVFSTERNKTEEPIKTTLSNDDGTFIIEDLPQGIFNLVCEYQGYVPKQMVGIQLRKGGTQLAYVQLREGRVSFEGEMDLEYTYAALQARLSQKTSVASLNEEALTETPNKAYIIRKEDIVNRGYTSIAEVLMDIPEIEIQNYADPEFYNHITIRGASGNEKVQVLINGMRVTSMAASIASIDRAFSVHHAKRIEILMGAASAIYGADAFSGVINIVTHDFQDKTFHADVYTSYGLYNTTDNAVSIGGGNDALSFNVGASFYGSDMPALPNFYPEEFAGALAYDEGGIVASSLFSERPRILTDIQRYRTPRQAYSVHGSLKTKIGIELTAYHNSDLTSSSNAGRPEYYLRVSDAIYQINLSSAMLSYQYKAPNQKWNLRSSAQWNYYEIAPRSQFVGIFNNFEGAYKFGFDHNARLQEIFTYSINENNNIIVGADFTYTYALPKTPNQSKPFERGVPDATAQGLYYANTDYIDIDGVSTLKPIRLDYFSRYNIGGFVQYQGNLLNERLRLTLGARFDYNSDYGFNINPRLGVVFKAQDRLNIRAAYTEGFLAPSPLQLYENFGSINAVQNIAGAVIRFESPFWHLPNPDLKASKTRNIELGFNYTKGDLYIGLDAFFRLSNNLIQPTFIDNDTTFIGIEVASYEIEDNVGQEYVIGGTLETRYEQGLGGSDKKLTYYGAYTFMDGRRNETAPVPYAAKHTAKAGILFNFKGLSINISGVYRSRTFGTEAVDNNGTLIYNSSPSFVVLNAHAAYRISLGKTNSMSIFVQGDNITNARYYNVSIFNSANFNHLNPQNPIGIQGGLRFNFK